MRAEVLEDFLLATPEFQWRMIEQQRELDRLRGENERLREQHLEARLKLLETHLPFWRRWLVHGSWWLYCRSMPKWAR